MVYEEKPTPQSRYVPFVIPLAILQSYPSTGRNRPVVQVWTAALFERDEALSIHPIHVIHTPCNHRVNRT